MELYYLKKLDQVAIASDAPDLVSRCYAIDERLVKLIKRLNKTAGTTASRLATREMLNDMQEAINSLYDLL